MTISQAVQLSPQLRKQELLFTSQWFHLTLRGTVVSVVDDGQYTINDTIVTIKKDDGSTLDPDSYTEMANKTA